MSYLSISDQDNIYNSFKLNLSFSREGLNCNITSIIILYLTNTVSWKRIQYNNSYMYIPRTFHLIFSNKINNYILCDIYHYVNRYKSRMHITNKYIDNDKIWDKTLINDDMNSLLALVCGNNINVKYYKTMKLIKENKYYILKLNKYCDAYKTFIISLFPFKNKEIISSTYLCILQTYYNEVDEEKIYIPICELIQLDDNKFSLPGYLSVNYELDYYIKFEIENDDIFDKNIDRLINVETLYLDQTIRLRIINDIYHII